MNAPWKFAYKVVRRDDEGLLWSYWADRIRSGLQRRYGVHHVTRMPRRGALLAFNTVQNAAAFIARNVGPPGLVFPCLIRPYPVNPNPTWKWDEGTIFCSEIVLLPPHLVKEELDAYDLYHPPVHTDYCRS